MQAATSDSEEHDTDAAGGEPTVASRLARIEDELSAIGMALEYSSQLHVANSMQLQQLVAQAEPKQPLP